jgi:hypothetical protein
VTQGGDYVLDLHVGTPFVLAYLDTGTLYSVQLGERVRVSDGFRDGWGRVSRIYPVADQLPAEFQKAFKPRGRNQVVRVDFEGNRSLPLQSKVSVRSASDPMSWGTVNSGIEVALNWGETVAKPAAQGLVRRVTETVASAWRNTEQLAEQDQRE